MLKYESIFYACLAVNIAATASRFVSLPAFYRWLWRRPSQSSRLASSRETKNAETDEADRRRTRTHRNLLYFTYLPVYLLATMADWLQGPYKYALYSAYGYTQSDIATLFVAGFGSGMLLGSVVGGYADSMGRRKLAIVYCLSYTLSVLAKHARPFPMLLIGRVFGGISTSLLYSVFESWLIKAHALRGVDDPALVSASLSVSTYGSSVVAIISGLLANAVVSKSGPIRPMFGHDLITPLQADAFIMSQSKTFFFYKGGYIAAFDLTLLPLILCAILALVLWEENYGEKETSFSDHNKDESDEEEILGNEVLEHDDGDRWGSDSININKGAKHRVLPIVGSIEWEKSEDEDETPLASPSSPGSTSISSYSRSRWYAWACNTSKFCGAPLQAAARTVWNNGNILTCCIISSLFEGSMYVFIFMWTPTLTALEAQPGVQEADQPPLPLGYVFASFMVCCMLGTLCFSFMSNRGVSAPTSLVFILALSALSCAAMAVTKSEQPKDVGSNRSLVPYLGMLTFEGCIGAYYPAMGTVKAMVVPENQRSAIYNIFRLPLNFIVLINLFMLGNLSHVQSFLLCGAMLTTATFLQFQTSRRIIANMGSSWMTTQLEETQPLTIEMKHSDDASLDVEVLENFSDDRNRT